jgi:hypothetical protein
VTKINIIAFNILLFVAGYQFSNAQVVINEVSSDNESVIADEFGSYSDWIELYNSGTTTVNLSGFYLSDNNDDLLKWSFPNIIIEPGSFLLIFASGQDGLYDYPHTNFKLAKDGESLLLSDNQGVVLDHIYIPLLEGDESFGRQPDGSSGFHYFVIPTPLSSNNNSQTYDFAPTPVFSIENQFSQQPVALELSTNLPNYSIRYTKDGSIPNESSLLYQAAIEIDSTTCIRAICFATEYRPSHIATNTYFIQEDIELPVIALSSAPDNFWDPEEGMLVDGPNADTLWPFYGANYWHDIEIPVHFEYFTEEGNLGTEYELGARVHGGRGARTKPQKPLRLLAKKSYGAEEMHYPFFEDRAGDVYKRLVLRNGSGDYNVAHFRDGMVHRMYIRDELNVDALAYKPVVVFLNGEFYGILNLREKSDEYYLKYQYDIDVNQLDFLEEDTIVILGDFEKFNQDCDFVVNNDLSNASNYQQASTLFDVTDLIDYAIAQTAINNSDSYGNNIKFWRVRKADAHWRYILFDLESGLGRYGWTLAGENVFERKMIQYADTNRHINIFKAFLGNETFKHNFLNRYADLLNTTFREERMEEEIIFSRDLIAHDMVRHFERWGWPGYDIWWNQRMDGLFEFAEQRPSYARDHLQDYFDLPGQVKLNLQVYPENAGIIKINTIIPGPLPWDGVYFNGVPVQLTIEPNPGFKFKYWKSLETIKEADPQTSISYNFEQDDQIVAYFEAEYSGLDLQAAPNILNTPGAVQLSFLLDDRENVEFMILDASGKQVKPTQIKEMNGGRQNYTLDIGNLAEGMYFIMVKTLKEVQAVKIFVY